MCALPHRSNPVLVAKFSLMRSSTAYMRLLASTEVRMKVFDLRLNKLPMLDFISCSTLLQDT